MDEDSDDDWQDDFDYDEYVNEHHSSDMLSSTMKPLWKWTAIALLTLIVLGSLYSVLGR